MILNINRLTGPIEVVGRVSLDEPVTARFSIANNSNKSIDLGEIRIAARGPNNEWMDFPSDNNSLVAAGETYTYTRSRTFNGPEGDYRLYVARRVSGQWKYPPLEEFNEDGNGETTVLAKLSPVLEHGLEISSSVHKEEMVEATFTVRNPSQYSAEIGVIKPAARGPNNEWMDFPSDGVVTIPAGGSYRYSKHRSFPDEGIHHIWIASKWGGLDWTNEYPLKSTSVNAVRALDVDVKPQVTITRGLSVSSHSATPDHSVRATFVVKNHGTTSADLGYIKPAGRRTTDNLWMDFPYSPYILLQPGESYEYSEAHQIPHTGDYRLWIANKRKGHDWSATFPSSENTGIARTTNVSIRAALRITSGLSISGSGYKTAQFTIHNFSNKTQELGYIKPAGRRTTDNLWMDFPYSPYIYLMPGRSYTYSLGRSLPPGNYRLWIANKRNGEPWSGAFPLSESTGIIRALTISSP